MALLEAAAKQAIVVRCYAGLGSKDDAERYKAMAAMRECGDAAKWCLRLAIQQAGQPRVQLAAAVVLHWLGDRAGLLTLTEALKWRASSEPQLPALLESAFITIGSPDAVAALLTVWNMLPDWGDHELVRTVICRVWSALRNPTVLPHVAAKALINPARFEQTVLVFGEMAIPVLRDLTAANDADRRALAVQTLRHIPGQRAFSSLLPLLTDPEISVRALVPAALERTGTLQAALPDISRAVRQGFPSIEAVSLLCAERPVDLAETFSALFESWSPPLRCDYASEIFSRAMPAMLQHASDHGRTLRALCRVLGLSVSRDLSVSLILAIETLARKVEPADRSVMDSLLEQLASPWAEVRQQAACSLGRLGDPLPAKVIAFLDECRPQDSLFSQLQVILRGGRDAGAAATQAVQQVTKWWGRLTADAQEAVRRADPTGGDLTSARSDPRFAAILSGILAAAIRAKESSLTTQEQDDRVALVVLLLRALARLGCPAALEAWHEIVSVLHLAGYAFSTNDGRQAARHSEVTGAAAAEALMALYGPDSFGLFLAAIYSPDPAVARTGITALGMLGDSRAVPHLRWISCSEGHPCADMAAQAIAQIRRTNPEMMSLLRGSAPLAHDTSTLLRAANGNSSDRSSERLLRPVAEPLE